MITDQVGSCILILCLCQSLLIPFITENHFVLTGSDEFCVLNIFYFYFF